MLARGHMDPIGHGICWPELEPDGQNEPAWHAPVTASRPGVAQNEPGGHASCTLMAVKGQNEPIGHVICAPTVAGQ